MFATSNYFRIKKKKSTVQQLLLFLCMAWSCSFFGSKLVQNCVTYYLQKRFGWQGSLNFVEVGWQRCKLGIKDFQCTLCDGQLQINAAYLEGEFCLKDWWRHGQNFINVSGYDIKVAVVGDMHSLEDTLQVIQKMLCEENIWLGNCSFNDCCVALPQLDGVLPCSTVTAKIDLQTLNLEAAQNTKQLTITLLNTGAWQNYCLEITQLPQAKDVNDRTGFTAKLNNAVQNTLLTAYGELVDKSSWMKFFHQDQLVGCAQQQDDCLKINACVPAAVLKLPIATKDILVNVDCRRVSRQVTADFSAATSQAQEAAVFGNVCLDLEKLQLDAFAGTGDAFGALKAALRCDFDKDNMQGFVDVDRQFSLVNFAVAPSKLWFWCDDLKSAMLQFKWQRFATPVDAALYGNLRFVSLYEQALHLDCPGNMTIMAQTDWRLPLKIHSLDCLAGRLPLLSLCKTEDATKLRGVVNVAVAKHLFLSKELAHRLRGQLSSIDFTLTAEQPGLYGLNFATADGMELYFDNFINPLVSCSCQAFFNVQEREFLIPECRFQFKHGQADIKGAACKFGDLWQPVVLYTNVVATDLVVNKDQYFYALLDVDGSLHWNFADTGKLFGNVQLKQSSYSKNFIEFEEEPIPGFVKDLDCSVQNAKMLDLDVKISSQQPLNISSVAIDAKANVDLRVQAQCNLENMQFHNTKLSGDVAINTGKLKILGNTLDIKRCVCKFIPALGVTPFIDVSACGKFKKYNINMYVFGNLQEPKVRLRSTPEMSEEQIATLLLSGFGDKHKSLMQFFPGIIIKQLEDEVFRGNKTISKLGQVMKNITNPASGLKISPCLIDSKLDNLGAAVSFNLGPKLHALASKGLHSHDHLSLQMEYLISKNVSLKVGRASHGNLEGELEFKCKF